MTLLGRDYAKESFSHDGITHDVYARGRGPGVLLMHELPGLAEATVRLADRLVEAGYTVALPHLFGFIQHEKGPRLIRKITRSVATGTNLPMLCMSREFARLRGGVAAPVTDWLRALTRRLSERTGGGAVGAIGMCLTGGYVIALAIDPWVAGAVCAQPAVPPTFLPGGTRHAHELSVSDDQLRQAAARDGTDAFLLGFRFTNDSICPEARFDRLREAFGTRFEECKYTSPDPSHRVPAKAHSVLSYEYEDAPGDDDTHPTRKARARLLDFLGERLGPRSTEAR